MFLDSSDDDSWSISKPNCSIFVLHKLTSHSEDRFVIKFLHVVAHFIALLHAELAFVFLQALNIFAELVIPIVFNLHIHILAIHWRIKHDYNRCSCPVEGPDARLNHAQARKTKFQLAIEHVHERVITKNLIKINSILGHFFWRKAIAIQISNGRLLIGEF